MSGHLEQAREYYKYRYKNAHRQYSHVKCTNPISIPNGHYIHNFRVLNEYKIFMIGDDIYSAACNSSYQNRRMINLAKSEEAACLTPFLGINFELRSDPRVSPHQQETIQRIITNQKVKELLILKEELEKYGKSRSDKA